MKSGKSGVVCDRRKAEGGVRKADGGAHRLKANDGGQKVRIGVVCTWKIKGSWQLMKGGKLRAVSEGERRRVEDTRWSAESRGR